jgi:hypothetical protein
MDYSNNRMREELYSQAISAGKRKYFFDVKETKAGDKFIVIAESRKIFDNNTGNFTFEKNKMFLYKEDFEKFQRGLTNAISFIETGVIPEEPESYERHFSPVGEKDDNIIDGIDFNI